MQVTRRIQPAFTPVAAAALAFAVCVPASAETEIEALRRELAEQRLLIQQLMAAQQARQAPAIPPAGADRGTGQQAAPPAAPAAPALTVYGVADVNVSRADSGFGAKTNIGSGGYTASRLGVKGEKNLADGVKAVFLLEAGLSVNTGTAGTGTPALGINATVASTGALTGAGTQLFSRQAYAGLKLPIGTLAAGRQYAGSYLAAVTESTAFGPGLYGSSATFLPLVASMPTRLNNSLVYLAPNIGGASAQLTLTSGAGNNVDRVAGSGASATTDRAGRGGDLAVSYSRGGFKSTFTAWHVRNGAFNPSLGESGLATRRGFQLGGNVDVGPARIHATYVRGKIAGGGYEQGTKSLSDVAGWSASAGVPMGGGTVLASFTRVNDKSLLPGKDASLVGMAYTYKLLGATTLYASWGKMLNGSNAAYSLLDGGDLVGSVAAPGFDPSGFMVGLNHVF